jgi:hypothetical protein
MLTQLLVAGGIAALASCSGGGVVTGGPCALRLSETAAGFALTGEIADTAVSGWSLEARALDGAVDIRQSGPPPAVGAATQLALPGRAADYRLAMTVTRGGETLACPLLRH